MHSKEILIQAKNKLLEKKAELIQQKFTTLQNIKELDVSGDETDQSVRNIHEIQSIGFNERCRMQLMEIESALARITEGSFGICEVTGDLIEEQRLLAIPWTRLSIEGAEYRESLEKKYAR